MVFLFVVILDVFIFVDVIDFFRHRHFCFPSESVLDPYEFVVGLFPSGGGYVFDAFLLGVGVESVSFFESVSFSDGVSFGEPSCVLSARTSSCEAFLEVFLVESGWFSESDRVCVVLDLVFCESEFFGDVGVDHCGVQLLEAFIHFGSP